MLPRSAAAAARSAGADGLALLGRRPRATTRPAAAGRSRPVSAGRGEAAAAGNASASASASARRDAQRRAYEHYRKKDDSVFGRVFGGGGRAGGAANAATADERNARMASYALAAVVGALGATYASVPLYKVFCQATGFGGTTQRVSLGGWAADQEEREATGAGRVSQALWAKLREASNVPASMLPSSPGAGHGRQGGARTWTDEEAAARLATLRPVAGGRLITVRFDSTVGDVLPWEFVPTQLDVKVVPGETALSFFTATNNSDRAITGVATYNVHPPRAGAYFNKIQCFCFEEQRLLPGETVDMPVFFFIDPEFADDPQLSRCANITLSYTFFQTDLDDEDDDDEADDEEVVPMEGGGRRGSKEARSGEGGRGGDRWWGRLAFWRRGSSSSNSSSSSS